VNSLKRLAIIIRLIISAGEYRAFIVRPFVCAGLIVVELDPQSEAKPS